MRKSKEKYRKKNKKEKGERERWAENEREEERISNDSIPLSTLSYICAPTILFLRDRFVSNNGRSWGNVPWGRY